MLYLHRRGSGPLIQDLRKRLDIFYLATSDDDDEDPNGTHPDGQPHVEDTPCERGAEEEAGGQQLATAQMLRVQSLPEPTSSISTPFQTGCGQRAVPAGPALATPPVPRSGSGKKRLQPAEAAETSYRPGKLRRSQSCI